MGRTNRQDIVHKVLEGYRLNLQGLGVSNDYKGAFG